MPTRISDLAPKAEAHTGVLRFLIPNVLQSALLFPNQKHTCMCINIVCILPVETVHACMQAGRHTTCTKVIMDHSWRHGTGQTVQHMEPCTQVHGSSATIVARLQSRLVSM